MKKQSLLTVSGQKTLEDANLIMDQDVGSLELYRSLIVIDFKLVIELQSFNKTFFCLQSGYYEVLLIWFSIRRNLHPIYGNLAIFK